MNMSRPTKDKITHFQLAKIEKRFNGQEPKYFYHLGFENIEELLILEVDYPIKDSLVGLQVKYKLEDNIVIDFELI